MADDGDESDFELDDMLESALDDLDEQEKSAAESEATFSAEPVAATASAVQQPVFGPEPPPALGVGQENVGQNIDDTMKELMQELENGDLKTMMAEAEQSPEFKMLMDAFSKMDPAAGDNTVASSTGASSTGAPLGNDGIDSTLKMLEEAMEQVGKDRTEQGGNGGMGLPEMSPEDMEQMKGLLGGLGENGDFQQYLDKIMQQMMSKDVLEGPMRQIDEKYKEFFTENPGMSPEDEAMYRKQHDYVREILAEYAKADCNTERVATLMQEMQECGQPPPQITKELAGALGGEGLQNIPGLQGLGGDDQACHIM